MIWYKRGEIRPQSIYVQINYPTFCIPLTTQSFTYWRGIANVFHEKFIFSTPKNTDALKYVGTVRRLEKIWPTETPSSCKTRS